MTTGGKHAFFGRNASVLLDVVRFAAAFAVAATHTQQSFVAGRHIVPDWSGNFAVCVFFVLSGFVIRYITVSRVSTPTEYWIDRVSRIYSVVLPVLLLGVALEGAARLYAPEAFHVFAQPYAWSHVPKQLLTALTFTSGWWSAGEQPLSNGAYWSLMYECVYYVLYGLVFFKAKARWWLVPLLLMLTGPSVAPLFLIWLLGVVLYEVYARLHAARWAAPMAGAAGVVFALLLFAARHPVRRFLAATDVAHRVQATTQFVHRFTWGRVLYGDAPVAWLDRLSTSYFIAAPAVALLLLFLLLALDRYMPPLPARAAKGVRFIADSTFTLYLLHLPMLGCIMSFIGHPLPSWRSGSVLLAVLIVISVALAWSFDKLKNLMRARLRTRFVRAA